MQNLAVIGGKDCEAVTKTPSHGQGFDLGSIKVTGLHTPCHTQDSICWFMEDGGEKVVFTGDTLFHGGENLWFLNWRRGRGLFAYSRHRLRQVLRGLSRRDAQGSERDSCVLARRHSGLRK